MRSVNPNSSAFSTSIRVADALTFPGGYGKKSRRLLFHIRTPAMRALGIFLAVLGQAQSGFEGLMTSETNIVIYGHGEPPGGNA